LAQTIETKFPDDEFDLSEAEGLQGEPQFQEGAFIQDEDMQGGSDRLRHTTTIRINGTDYPIVIEERVAYLAKHILTHNDLIDLSTVVFQGKSGSGKSTLTQTLTHYIHLEAEKQGRSYAIKWFKQNDIERLDEIIASCEKGVNQIWIFEDVSFLEIEDEVRRKFTFVRHELKAKLILMLQIHYSKAMDPFMRDGDFQIITSISKQEKENLLILLGRNDKTSRYYINAFERKYNSMITEGYYISIANGNRIIRHYTMRPFKVALVNDAGKLHFTNYHKASCSRCEKREADLEQADKTMSLSNKDFLLTTANMYGHSKTKTQLRNRLHYQDGLDSLDRRSKYLDIRIAKYYHEHPDEWVELVEKVKKHGSVDGVFRELGITTGKKTREELRGEKLSANKTRRALARKLKTALPPPTPITEPVTKEMLEVAGVPTNDPGPMNDEEINQQ
jgi:hypothetical protein